MRLRDFDPAAFLRDHWQKQPLLIRNAWDGWTNPLSPDELAGLACEEDVESRLIERRRSDWRVEHGPFAERRLRALGKAPWTLLVQSVDSHVPEVAALRAPFRFIPNWRIDDVMVSLARDGGGVGAHFDQYDVFLIQGLGRRRWQIGGRCDEASALLPHDDLRLLADFEPTGEWLLEPGDILYLPPRVAHNGIAVGDDCMTYSIGFRAPARAELIAHWSDHVAASRGDDDRYADPDLALQTNPGEIEAGALDRLYAMMREALDNRPEFARWFGRFATMPKWDGPAPPDASPAAIAAGTVLTRHPASRFAYVADGRGVSLFVDGEYFACGADAVPLAQALCAADRVTLDADTVASAEATALIEALCAQGSLLAEG